MLDKILQSLLGTTAGANFVSKATETQLAPSDEKLFSIWKEAMAPEDSGFDYDYRGAYKAGAAPAENLHWPDTFKKPTHPTYSDQSQYAIPGVAGSWEGENFTPSVIQQLMGEIMQGQRPPIGE